MRHSTLYLSGTIIPTTSMSTAPFTTIFIKLLFVATYTHFAFSYEGTNAGCNQSEKEALLMFKRDLKDPLNRLASWTADADCCNWTGVICSNSTGLVVELHLRSLPYDENQQVFDFPEHDFEVHERSLFGGTISDFLLNLTHLRYLDLSYNNFGGIHIPKFLGSIGSLRYLNLSNAGFGDAIPHELGNLTNLLYLNLQGYAFSENLHWLSGLSQLQFLDLSGMNLSKALNWMEVISTLPSLAELHLSSCLLPPAPAILNVNISSLFALDLSENWMYHSSFFSWVSRFKYLKRLNLADNSFQGPHITRVLQNLTSLVELDLSGNYINSSVPNWLLYGLSHLQILNLAYNGLSRCQVPRVSPLLHVNFSSLSSLDLSGNRFDGYPFPNCIFGLRNLKSLFLSMNDFQGPIPNEFKNMTSLIVLDLHRNCFSSIPSWFPDFANLQVLDLASNYLQGKISVAIANTTSLTSLDLSGNEELVGRIPSSFKNLCNLEILSLEGVKLSQDVNEVFESLSGCGSNSLKSLNLRNCDLFGNWITKDLGQFKSLVLLDLSWNLISGPIPTSLGELSFMRSLDLSYNKLNGNLPVIIGKLKKLEELYIWGNSISGSTPSSLGELIFLRILELGGNELNGTLPESFGNLKKLELMDISLNSISGPLPASLGELSALRSLLLSNNKLNGTLPPSFGRLTNLDLVDISYNSMEGTVSESHFANLTWVSIFAASGNQMKLRVRPDWIPPLQLEKLELGSWHIGPQFPSWIRPLKHLSELDLSKSKISSSIPLWLFNMSTQFYSLNLSYNQIRGVLPNTIQFGRPGVLDLSWNHFKGALPQVLPYLIALDLSNNLFSGSISKFLCHKTHVAQLLNLEKNLLYGEIPNCWERWPLLKTVKLSNNNFSGKIPVSIGALVELESLHLRNNTLSGELPLSLQNCTSLVTLDIGENKLVGKMPKWIGERLSNLVNLNLRTNSFGGGIPEELCHATSLHTLDLANNNFSGAIPRCISNFRQMVNVSESSGMLSILYNGSGTFFDSMFLHVKGEMLEYGTILGFVRGIDVSNNRLSGEIPEEITSLKGLLFLNLSHNFLRGRIPEEIGSMKSLESIDFCGNQLSGEIPQSLSSLTFLSRLNLSNNNLSGRIPSSTQLRGFDSSSFMGNKLCGPPLTNNCGDDITPRKEEERRNKGHVVEINWFFVSMAFGFVAGFWGVVGPLLFNRHWRWAYFRFLEKVGDDIWWRCM